MFVRPIRLGNLSLRSNLIYSPLAGCSDYPFREIASRYRPALLYCEMVKMDALIRHDAGTYRLLDYSSSMRPIGAQLCGSKPDLAGPCAKIIEEMGFNVVDLNCGCPVDKVTKDKSGSGLLKHPELIGDILSNMVAAVKIPVTVKIRSGWDENQINAIEVAKIAEEAGAKAIAIHGRTRKQKYRGFSDRNIIKQVKQAVSSILVFGNGDVFSPRDGIDLFRETGCDGILLSRGTMGAPWLAEQIEKMDRAEEVPLLHISDYKKALLEHFETIVSYQTERQAVLDLRRVACWYLRGSIGTKELRFSINRAQNLSEIRSIIGELH